MRFSLQNTAALAAASLTLALFAPHSSADIEEKVAKSCAGQILITAESVDPSSRDGDTTARACKAKDPIAIKGMEQEEDQSWSFSYLAFLSKAPRKELTFDFFDVAAKKGGPDAQKSIAGVNPKSRIVSGRLEVAKSDGLTKGKTYKVVLTAVEGGKRVTLATGSIKAE